MSMKKNELSSDGMRVLRSGLVGALAVAALGLSSGAAFAETGMIVVRDAETGALRAPNAAEFKAMQIQKQNESLSHSTEPKGILSGTAAPKAVKMSHGGVRMELTDDTMTYSVATRNADGTTDMQCVVGADAAAKVLNGTSATPASKEHQHDIK